MNKKIQNHEKYNINCLLKCKYNWFSEKSKKHIWRGLYACIDEKCTSLFEAKIKNTKKDLLNIESLSNEIFCTLLLKYEEKNFHSKRISKVPRICGDERKELGLKLANHGVSNVLSENVIKNIEKNSKGDCYKLVYLI